MTEATDKKKFTWKKSDIVVTRKGSPKDENKSVVKNDDGKDKPKEEDKK